MVHFTTKNYRDSIKDLKVNFNVKLNRSKKTYTGLTKEFCLAFLYELKECGVNTEGITCYEVLETFNWVGSKESDKEILSVEEKVQKQIDECWKIEDEFKCRDEQIDPIPYVFMMFVRR